MKVASKDIKIKTTSMKRKFTNNKQNYQECKDNVMILLRKWIQRLPD